MTSSVPHSVGDDPIPEQNGAVIWLIGLSAVGKSAVARELVRQLSMDGLRAILLDGDELRRTLDVVGPYDAESRRRLAYVYARLCRLLASQGQTVVCASITLIREVHRWNRAHLPRYLEVLLDVPMAELRRRNPKGIYDATRDGHDVVGIGVPAEFPVTPDLVIQNFGRTTPPLAAEHIRQRFWERGAQT